ncbi:hypothetical protein [Salisaeta longa]|uniref:hypothetical protein n=1 Tax=Salisaeta longa TaxID=503170 RepID=UPI0003B644E9|nr:hypothetical protein [Salisaeta longa]
MTFFDDFPPTARLWIHTSDAPLTEAQQTALHEAMAPFFASWSTHGRPVRGALAIAKQRFVLLAGVVQADDAGISGCGIDAAVQALNEAAAPLDIAWAPALHVAYEDASGVHVVPRTALADRVAAGAITGDTPIFDRSIQTVGALHDGRFARAARATWLAQRYSLAPASTASA